MGMRNLTQSHTVIQGLREYGVLVLPHVYGGVCIAVRNHYLGGIQVGGWQTFERLDDDTSTALAHMLPHEVGAWLRAWLAIELKEGK
jgi:hypothetical protein